MILIVSALKYLLVIICVLVAVAFVTLSERKVLEYVQIRSGPTNVGISGIMQPFSDAVKLFSKEQTFPVLSNFFVYYLSPVFSLTVSLVGWSVMPYDLGMMNFYMGALFFLCCLSLGVYPVMSAGWSSNSKYSLLGSLRAVAQTISYEVSLALALLSFLFLTESFNFELFSLYQEKVWFLWITLPLSGVWLASCLAETNRTAFDFAEGESELVSGFNTEYSGGGFALIFMSEHSSILFMSMLFGLMLLGGNLFSFFFYVKLVGVAFVFIWVRGTLPRFRYDKLMYLAWKSFLPVSLNYLIFSWGLNPYVIVYLSFNW